MARRIRYKDIERFDGGFVGTDSIGIGDEALNMVRYASNVRQRGGSVTPRGGMSIYSDFSERPGITGQDLHAIYEYRRMQDDGGGSYSSYKSIVFTVGTDIYYVEIDNNPDLPIKINSVALSSNDVYCVNAFDHLFVGNGADPIMVWDGQNWLNCMFDAPPSFPFVTNESSPTGLLGVAPSPVPSFRSYKYTYYTPASATYPHEKESNVSLAWVTEFTAENGEWDIPTAVDFPDTQVTRFRLYGTALAASIGAIVPDYFLLGTLGPTPGGAPIPLTFTDNVVDISGKQALHGNTHGVPDTYKYLLFDGAWLLGARSDLNESDLGWSNIGQPFYWDSDTDYERIGGDDADEITGLGMIGRVRYIFKTNSVHRFAGDPTLATEIIPVEVLDASMNMTRLSIGCADPRSLASWANSLIFRAADGHVYQLTRDSITQLSRYIKTEIQMLDSDAKGAIYDDYYVISSGLLTLVCDLHKGELGWQGYDTDIYPNGMLVTADGFVLGTENDTIVRYYNNGLSTDYGADITKQFQPLYLNVGAGNRFSIFRSIIANTPNRSTDMSIVMYNENGSIGAASNLTYTSGASELYIPQGARGNNMSVRFSWDGIHDIIKISMGYQPSKRR